MTIHGSRPCSPAEDVLIERPSDTTVRRWLALLDCATRRFSEAIRRQANIRQNHPTDVFYLDLFSSSYQEIGNFERAISSLELTI